MVFLKLLVRFIGLVSTLILVRLLEPSDFGIVAMAMSVVAALELLTAFSFDITLIQNQKAESDEYNTAWTLNVLLGAGAAVLLFLLAHPAARFYGEPALVTVFQVIAIVSLLQGLENIGMVDFRKYLKFEKEFLFQVLVKVFAFVITISLAYKLRSYWALVLGTVASRVIALGLSYVLHPYRPRFTFTALHKIFHFSKWLFLNNMMHFVRFRGLDFIVGKLAGSSGLGMFSIAFEISNLPTTELIAPINRALFPGFAKVADDSQRTRDAFMRVASLLALISLPTGFGIAATAHLFTPIVLGEKWMATIPLIQMLAVFGAISAVQSPVGTTILALGKPRTVFLLAVANALILIPATILMTVSDGIEGTATAMLLTQLLFLPVYYGIGARFLQLGVRDVATIFFRPTVAAIAMYITVLALFGASPSEAFALGQAIFLGATVFVSVILILWIASKKPADSAESYLLNYALSKLPRTARSS
jgi:O-antigen/teichoic acid export membrane protein